MRRLLIALGAVLAAVTLLLPAASTNAAPKISCRFEAMDAGAHASVTQVFGKFKIDATWDGIARCPLYPWLDGAVFKFHETSVLERSGPGKLSGNTYIQVNESTSLPSLPGVFWGQATGTYSLDSGLNIAVNWMTLSQSLNGFTMFDPHQYLLIGPSGNTIDFSADGLMTTISN